jgi:hypothetical protein
MGVTNLDALTVSGAVAAGSLTVGGSPVVAGLAAIGKGTTPASGWTVSGNHCYKDVTVTGAAASDVVICTLNAAPFASLNPMDQRIVLGYVTGANTVRLYYTVISGGSIATGATTIDGTVSYILFRPS